MSVYKWIERFVLLIFLINFIQVPHSGDLNFSFSNFESYLIWFDDIWRKLNRNRLLHLIHQLLLQLRKDSFYFFLLHKDVFIFCVKSVHGSFFFYYNTCLIISKTFSLRQKPCIYNLPVMCFSREKIWSSAVIIDFLQSFDNQKKNYRKFRHIWSTYALPFI